MVIRTYRRSDAREFTGLVRALARYERLTPPTPAANRRLIRDAGSGRIRVLVAESGHRLIGYAIWFLTYSSFLARPTLYLEDIFVTPGQQRRGVGGAFFERLYREALRLTCGRMEWNVLDWNAPAHRFYRRLKAKPLRGWTMYRKTFRVR